MKEANKGPQSLTRRKFLRGAAGVTGAALLASCVPAGQIDGSFHTGAKGGAATWTISGAGTGAKAEAGISSGENCDCPNWRDNDVAPTEAQPLNPDDNEPLHLEAHPEGPGIFLDVEDTSAETEIRPDGSGEHNIYSIYIAPGQSLALPAYADPAGRRRVWRFQPTDQGGNPTMTDVLCHLQNEAQTQANELAASGLEGTVRLFGVPVIPQTQ